MEATEVLDTNLLMEGRAGLTTAFNVVEYPKSLERNVEVLWPVREDFAAAISIMIDLLNAETPVPAVDFLVAAMCINRGFKLLTKDEHFAAIRSVRATFKLSVAK